MATYLTQSDVNSLLKTSMEKMISECRSTKHVPGELVELIKHNLYAKYVTYDTTKDYIEIGVNESKIPTTTYTTIKVSSFPLNEIWERLMTGYKQKPGDLEFYTKILEGKYSNDTRIQL